MIEVEVHDTDVEVVSEIGVESTGNVTAEVVDLGDLDITVAKKEYVITGDSIYIPVLYDDAPQWMKDLVSLTVDVSIETANASTLAQLSSILATFATSYVPLNQYTQSILNLSTADANMHAVIETLNSNFNDGLNLANSQIINLQTTKASKTEVVTQVINTLAAQLTTPGSDIGAVIASINQAIVNETTARANSFNVLNTSLGNVGENVAGNASAIHSLNTYVGVSNGVPNGSGALADIVILQKQNDGVIETITGTYDVMLNPQDPNLAELVLTAEPYASWRSADVTGIDTRLKHIGDVYIKYTVTSNGAREYIGSYKFIRTVVDVTDAHHSTDADGFTWALVVDQAAQDAYNQALNAYDLADNKRRVFTTTPYGPYDIGDLWTKTVSGGSTLYNATVKRVSGYVASDWVVADDAGLNTFVSTTYVPTVTSLQNQVDGKVESWYTLSTSDPKAAWTDAATRLKHDGDLWYQTDTKLSYWYSSSTNAWNLIDDAKAIQALADAATAQATADGKINSYYVATLADAQTMSNGWTTTEKSNNTGDLAVVWNDSTLDNNGTWRWNGTSWVTTRDKKLVSLASDVTTLRTDLNSGTGTWVTGDAQVTNNLTAVIEDTKATIESQWKYNSNLTLDGITYSTGFGLATSLTNGSGLPVGDSEFWIKADKFKLMSADGSKKSSYSPFTVDSVTGDINFNGKVTFSNVTGVSSSANMLYNSAPAIGLETKGWRVGYNDTGLPSSGPVAAVDPYRPTGYGAFLQYITGTPAVGKVFDIGTDDKIPVIGGQYYEASAYLNMRRCNGQICIQWNDSSGATITWSMGSIVLQQIKVYDTLADWGRSTLIAQAPANATSCYFYIRGISTGEDGPFVSVSMCYFGRASEGQTVISNWSEGISAGVSSSEVVSAINNAQTTTIDGPRITTGSITASQIRSDSVSADRLMAGVNGSTVWTNGGLVSQNFNGNVYGNIGSPTAGFRLSSGAAGTTDDPNIYGAYIKGSTIEGVTLNTSDIKVKAEGYPNNFGRVNYVANVAGIVMPGYGTGFHMNRVCSTTLSYVKLEGWHRGATSSLYAYLQYSLDGGLTWTTLTWKNSQAYGYQEAFIIYFAELFPLSIPSVTGTVFFRIIGNGSYAESSPVLVTIYNN